jgi:hypothetical protein
MWEYMTIEEIEPGPIDDIMMNKYGEQGWELVSVTTESDPHSASSYFTYVFKRPKE